MAKSSDWFPHSREKILEMARSWLSALPAKAGAWNIPAQVAQDLAAKKTAAEELFNLDTSAERTKTITARCKAAFDDLEAFMRDCKRRYFLTPPLVDADLVSLELKPRDLSPTPETEPSAQPEADLVFPGVHLIELKNIRPAGGARPGDGSDCGTRVYFGLSGPPSSEYKFRLTEPPASGRDLPYSEWASAKKLLLDLDGESGNTIWLCLRYETKRGKPGPFGPILKAIIP
ncbi:MAG: hypothetical protein LBG84_05140 [Treponema sp.]|jgi:hypothetical protein|nr:hypothetical protein [Treponema sp.]